MEKSPYCVFAHVAAALILRVASETAAWPALEGCTCSPFQKVNYDHPPLVAKGHLIGAKLDLPLRSSLRSKGGSFADLFLFAIEEHQ